MTAVIEVQNLTKHYKEKNALDNVSLTLEGGAIYGLLGRNGAGKTTLMSILTAQNFESSGTVRVFGEHPYENTHVLNRICFVRESQKYPDDAYPRHAFKAASLFFRNWSQELADELIEQFQLPMKQTIKKLSRGQLSAVGVIIGLASRAERPSSTSPTWVSTRSPDRSSTTVCSRTTPSTHEPSSSRRT